MNKVFKVIWNHATQSWVAVSELTSAKGKTKSKTSKLTALSLAVGSAMATGSVMAAVSSTITPVGVSTSAAGIAITAQGITSISATTNSDTSTPINVIYIGNNQTPGGIGDESVMIGNNLTGNSAGLAGDTVIGNRVRSGGGGGDSFATAAGYAAQVSGPSVSMGVGSSTDIGDDGGHSAVAQGAVAVGAFSRSSGSGSINGGVAVGALSSADQKNSVAIGTLSGVTTLGYDRTVTGGGNGGQLSGLSEARGDTLTSIGSHAGARSQGSIAIGSQATTAGSGQYSQLNSNNSIAVGTNAASIKQGSIAIGNDALAGGYNSSNLAQLNPNNAITRATANNPSRTYQAEVERFRTLLKTNIDKAQADATAENKFQVASTLASLDRAQLLVNRLTTDMTRIVAAGNTANTTNAMAIGNLARSVNANATAMGSSALAHGANSTATGYNAQAMGANALANGYGAIAGMTAADAATYQAYVSAAQNYTTSVNILTAANETYNYEIAKRFTDKTVERGQTQSNAQRALDAFTASGLDVNNITGIAALTANTGTGFDNIINAAKAIVNAQANVTVNQTLFNSTKSDADALITRTSRNTIAQGTNAIASANDTISIGNGSLALANYSISMGTGSNVSGTKSIAIGYGNIVSGNSSGAFGNDNTITSNKVFVLGNNVNVAADKDGGVVLGDNSTTATVRAVNCATVGTLSYGGFAGNLSGTTAGSDASDQGRFVSVGNSSSPRQLKFVAAGEITSTSTDAINGSQLYYLSDIVNNMGTSVATVIGGGSTLNPNGTINSFSQPLNTTGLAGNLTTADVYTPTTAADNVSQAITNLNNYVNAGWKIAEGDDTAAKARISPNEQVNFKAAGLATVSVAANGTGANVTYTVTKGEFNTTTNGTAEANATTTGAVTNADVATAINNSGWLTNVTDANGNVTTKVVTPGTQVNYVNGNGTAANVTVNGTTGVVSVSYDVNSTTGTVNPNGTASVADGNSFLNASQVANLVNNSSFNVTVARNDVFAEDQDGQEETQVKAGGNITYSSGKNIAISQNGSNFTFSTTKNVTFENANVTSTLAIGNASSTSSPVVNLKTENATTANVNNATTSPTAALNITSADGNATQIKGVASSLNTTTVTTFPSGTTNPSDATTGSTSNLLNLGNETNPLSDSVLNSVVTVRDLTNFGWVVSANGNNYTDTVKNANEVKFNGVNGITVTGNTTNGVRNINISLNTTTITSETNGTTSVTNGGSYVNASTVSNAINNAGWNTTVVNATTGASETVTVNPGDTVNYVNSSTATANVTVSKDANGKDVVNVTYDVNTGSITAADSNATITIKNADGSTSTIDNPDRGKVTVEEGQGDKVATVQNVADAINSAKWIASVEETGDEITTSTENDTGVAIGAGDELSFKAGKNLKIKRDGQEITYALANDINVTTVTATGNITVGTGDNATTINQGSITNLNDHLTAPTNATSTVTNATATTVPANVSTIGNQAATVNDVLNAGWNLQANGDAVDAVTHGNTVNFVSTDGSVTIKPTTDGSTSKLDFSVNATSIVTNAAGNVSANATTGKAVVGANGVANTTTGYANKVATVGDVANTINNTGWLTNVTDANGNVTTRVVTPGTQVNYVNGNGTTANVVANSTTGGLDVTFNVSQNKAGTQNANGTVTLADAANGTSTFLNAQDTVNLINSASFNVTTAKVDSFVTNQEGKENKAVKAGETITYTAGKNIAIKQDGANFTFATEQNVTFANANVTGTLAIGGDNNSPVVNISTGTGEHNNNGTTTSPNTVNMGNAQLTNVSAGANVYGANVDENGKPLTAVTVRNAAGQDEIKYYTADQFEANGALKSGATASTPVAANNVSKAVSGLADLASSNATNVMTVADAKNLGWVVSASDNDYADKVQNANQVNFKAEANTGVTVKGATNATTGVREIVVGNDYFKANATAGSTAANAAGSNSVAVGPNSVANTAGSVAIGNGANVTTSAPAGSVAIGQGATAGAVNTGAYRIDGSTDVAGAPNASTRVFSVGNASSPAQIQNVAAGVVSASSTDAVNGSQLHATNQAVINNARAIGNLNNKIDQVDKRGRKGTAIAGAIGMLPQPHISGKSMVSAATTNYRGEQAVAVGYSRLSDNGKHIIKLSGSSNVSGKKDAMVGAAYGYQW